MNSLFIFLVQSSIALLLFYMVYWAFLRKETHYNSNRFFLLFALLSSILMPLIPLQYTVMLETGINNSNLLTEIGSAFKGIQPYVGSGFETSYSLSWLDALLMIYLTGAAIFMIRILVQTAILCIQLIKNKTKSLDGIRIVETEKYGLPFSFFNIVYINPKFHKQDVLPEILAHEMVHIREKHWADLLIIELLTVIFWFNPIIWFFEHSIKLNHEYLADHGVISKGNPIGKYQALLVNQLMGMQIIGITNNLNFGINTNRLKMMTKQKTPKIKALKLVWAMPVLVILLFAFAEPNYKVIQPEIETVANSVQEKRDIEFSGTIVDEDGKALAGVTILIRGTSIGATSDIDGKFNLNINDTDAILLSYVGKVTLAIHKKPSKNGKINSWTLGKDIVLKNSAIVLDFDKMFLEEAPPPPPPAKKKNKTEEVFTVVEQLPSYPGGNKALGNYIKKMIQKLSKSQHIKGKAEIGFTVDKNGKVSNFLMIKSDNDNAARGAATILENMKKWNPGKQRGKNVSVEYIIDLEF